MKQLSRQLGEEIMIPQSLYADDSGLCGKGGGCSQASEAERLQTFGKPRVMLRPVVGDHVLPWQSEKMPRTKPLSMPFKT